MTWQERREFDPEKSQIASPNFYTKLMGFNEKLATTVVPPVTVVLEGRSISHCISLDKHTSYQSLAQALRQIFVDDIINNITDNNDMVSVDLSTAIPGYRIAYEDFENDLLLVGDLKWKDFVRVAKRIRILPIKENTRKRITTP